MLLSLSLRTVVLVVIGLGRVVCSGLCVIKLKVLGNPFVFNLEMPKENRFILY